MASEFEIFAADLEESNGQQVTIFALFNETEYTLGRTVPVNSVATELVELLRHIADGIEAVGLTREARSGLVSSPDGDGA